jgi:hypothetical protein
MERQHLVLVEAVAQAEPVPQLHRTVANDLPCEFSATVDAVRRSNRHVFIVEHRASPVEPSRFHCRTSGAHGPTPLERFTRSQSSGQTVAFPLPSMPRAGLTPIV